MTVIFHSEDVEDAVTTILQGLARAHAANPGELAERLRDLGNAARDLQDNPDEPGAQINRRVMVEQLVEFAARS